MAYTNILLISHGYVEQQGSAGWFFLQLSSARLDLKSSENFELNTQDGKLLVTCLVSELRWLGHEGPAKHPSLSFHVTFHMVSMGFLNA